MRIAQATDMHIDNLEPAGRGVAVFRGRYHAEAAVSRSGVRQYITPSTLCRLKPHSDGPEIDGYRIGYRLIDVDGGSLSTEVVYVEPGAALDSSPTRNK